MYAARFEQHDSREYLGGASNRPPGRHRIQNVEGPVLDPCAKQMYFKRGPKVDPLRIESGPSWRVCFWPLYFIRCAEALQAAMCEKIQAWSYFDTNSIRGGNLELGRPVFASLGFLVFWGPKNRPFFVTGRSKSRPDATLDPWAGSSARGRPGIPLCPPKQRSKCKFLQSEDTFVKQLVAVRRVCMCADAAKNDCLTLLNHCVEGVPTFEKLWRIRSQANHFW